MAVVIPNLKHLRACEAVLRTGSFSAAANEVFMSQPAVTQAVAKLEAVLSSVLFDRRPEGVFPTDIGHMFVNRVVRMQYYLATGMAEIMRSARRQHGQTAKLHHLVTSVQLRALVAIAEAGNFSLAARSIGVSQPSLHRAARDLEHLCGVPLFEKASSGILLTKLAEILVMNTKLALMELDQAYDEIEAWKGGRGGRVAIGSMPLARSAILPAAVNDLLGQAPDTRISIIDGPYRELLFALRHGDIDILIGALRDPVPVEDVVQTPLFNDPLAIVARVNHPLMRKETITIDDLAACAWVVPRLGAPTREYFETMFPEGGLRPQSVIVTGSLILIRRLLSTSNQLTIISRHQIAQEEKYGELRRLPFALSDTERPIGITTRKGWSPTAIQSDFLARLTDIGRRANEIW
mgnify:CR=1 FL=1|tara:strand:- start:9308 stop:10528 length:1221 start_codon:yes stop_codon:yes gene_type:complete